MKRLTTLLVVCPVLACLLTAVGCGSRGTLIEVFVQNEAGAPVVLWLTKDGPPVEEGWLSPGQVAAAYLPDEDAESGLEGLPAVVLADGEAVGIGPQRGRFNEGGRPVLRVFHDLYTLTELASVPRESSMVDNVYLAAGQNFVIVRRVEPVDARRVTPEEFQAGLQNAEVADE